MENEGKLVVIFLNEVNMLHHSTVAIQCSQTMAVN